METTETSPSIIRHFTQVRWFLVALLVGSILNMINQYDAIFFEGDIHWPKLALTYVVPYLVASVSAWYA